MKPINVRREAPATLDHYLAEWKECVLCILGVLHDTAKHDVGRWFVPGPTTQEVTDGLEANHAD